LSIPDPGYLREMVADHRTVVAAVEARDADGAEHALRHHLQMVLSAVPHLREVHPGYFDDEEREA
jgi:DNA-binding GntR family transcriptional regulator